MHPNLPLSRIKVLAKVDPAYAWHCVNVWLSRNVATARDRDLKTAIAIKDRLSGNLTAQERELVSE